MISEGKCHNNKQGTKMLVNLKNTKLCLSHSDIKLFIITIILKCMLETDNYIEY